MRLALLSIDSTVGDLEGNAAAILAASVRAVQGGAALVATPELSLLGYPPRDLLLRAGLVGACVQTAEGLAAQLARAGAGSAAVLVGTPWHAQGGSGLANACLVLRGGTVEAVYRKRLLPHYDVFDESRYFTPGGEGLTIEVGGARVALLLCEDLWRGEDVGQGGYACDPVADARASGADMVVAMSASPFVVGKQARRLAVLRSAAQRCGVPIAYVNATGANDDFVFEGGACLLRPDGRGVFTEPFGAQELCTSLDAEGMGAPGEAAGLDDVDDLVRAAIAGIRGYVRKSGHRRVLVGLSGGIDSAVVAALAVGALSAANVRGVCMPGAYSSPGSLSDAQESARLLGMAAPDVLPITPLHALAREHLAASTAVEGVTDENLQSRLRGLTLMALSNATGALVLCTGNKSELAVGYSTLYGDLVGGLAPLGDLTKQQVYAIARRLNASPSLAGLAAAPVPQGSIDKPPSAELRPGQVDQDSLPPYEILDAIVEGWVDEERSAGEIAARCGIGLEMVQRWTRAIDRAQYKRAQAPVILKLSPRAFGPGRRMPLAMRWNPPAR